MKKWFIGLLIVFALVLSGIYFFIPSTLVITKVTYLNCNSNAVKRFLSQESNWHKWWPENNLSSGAKMQDSNHTFFYNNASYTLSDKLYNGYEILINSNDSIYKTNLHILQLTQDSTAVNWECTIASSSNPFKRIQQYQEAVHIKNDMAGILDSMHSLLNNKDNVYGMQIQKTSVTDTFLIASKAVFPAYPSTADIYGLINQIKKYIQAESAKVAGEPIINITPVNNTQFELMAAVPANRELKGNEQFFFRKMVPGNFMAAEVRGGAYTVDVALTQLQFFMNDYQKTKMAIPFELLVTDRSVEPDTSKWITRIYQPAF